MKIICGKCRSFSPSRRLLPVGVTKGGAVLLCAALTAAAIHFSAGDAAALPTATLSRSDCLPTLSLGTSGGEETSDALPVSLSVDDELSLPLGGEEIDTGVSATYDGKLDIPSNVRLDKISLGSGFAPPLDKARVTSRFDYRVNPVTGRYVFHTGMDLGAAQGANIYAMKGGTVVRSAYDSGYGNYVIIEHENGIRTLYAHCSKRKVKTGDTVRKGQVIALVGSTGNSTGPHLHLEIRRGGCRYDPEWVIGGLYN